MHSNAALYTSSFFFTPFYFAFNNAPFTNSATTLFLCTAISLAP